MTGSEKQAYIPLNLRKQCSTSNNSSRLAPRGSLNRSTTQIPSTTTDLERRRQKFANDASKKEDEYGLISKGGDNRLQRDPEARKAYFKKIQEDFSELFAANDMQALRKLVSQLSLNDKQGDEDKFSNILMSLRKLREALLKFPIDEFSKSVFLFSIRVSTRTGHYQTYIPSISHILKAPNMLSKEELKEVVNLYCLHLSHFNNNDQLSLEVLLKYCKEDLWLRQVLEAWRTQDYKKWFDLYHKEKDCSKKKMMSFGEKKMIYHAIRCIQKSYNQLPKAYVWDLFQLDLEYLKKEYGCSWELKQDSKTIVIKSRA